MTTQNETLAAILTELGLKDLRCVAENDPDRPGFLRLTMATEVKPFAWFRSTIPPELFDDRSTDGLPAFLRYMARNLWYVRTHADLQRYQEAESIGAEIEAQFAKMGLGPDDPIPEPKP